MLDNKILANKNFVNSRFTKYHNRDANQAELDEYSGKGLFDVDKAISAGVPKPNTSIDSTTFNLGLNNSDIASSLPENTAGVIKEVEVANAQKFSEGAKNTLKIFEQQKKDAQTKRESLEKEIAQIETDRREQVTEPYKELSEPYRAKMEEAGNEEFQLKQKYDKYSNLAQSLTTYAEMAYNDIQKAQNAPGLESVIQGRANKVKEDYYSKISLTQTAMAALNDDISLGRTFIDRGIEAVTADKADELNFLNYVNDLLNTKSEDKKAELLTATTEEKTAIENRINTINGEFDRIESEKEAVQNFLIGDNAEIAMKAGVSLTDSLDEMVNKVAGYYKAHPEAFNQATNLTLEQKLKLREQGLVLDDEGNLIQDVSNSSVDQIAEAIKQIESGGDYNAKGGSGENGAYQFMPGTWQSWSSAYADEVLNKSVAELEMTPENQDAVAKWKIHKWIDQGYTPQQIASMWNSGSPEWAGKVGTNKHGVKYDVPAYVSKFSKALSQSLSEDTGDVSSADYIAATQLMTKLTKGKGTTEYKQEVLDNIINEIKGGKSIDQIEDDLRYSAVSEEFEGSFKGAFEFITKKGFSTQDREAAKDGLDELLEDGDIENAKYYVMGLARDKATADEKKNVYGREEALLALDSVEDALNRYIQNGGNTGLLTGVVEDFSQKILKKTSDQDLANIANEISIAIQTYRKAVSGAAFTEAESKEYDNIFPSVGKSKELNEAKLNSLRRVYERNQTAFYKRTMGAKYFDELFAEEMGGTENDPLGINNNDDPLGIL